MEFLFRWCGFDSLCCIKQNRVAMPLCLLWYTVNQNLRTRIIEFCFYVIFKAHMDFTELVGKGPHDLEMVITQVDPVYECLYEEFLEFDAIPIASVFHAL